MPELDAQERSVPAISLRGISKTYGAVTALELLDLDVGEGEFFCLLGPSGSGKTTILNVIGGFITPDSGTIAVRGERVERTPPHRRPVNTVFQGYALFPHMSVSDNVAFGPKMARVSKRETTQRVRAALELVGLEGHGDRFPHELSGGQQQRVAVARALVNRPAVLLLDEPLGALDLKLRKHLQYRLAEIHKDVGTTFVYVTHDQEEAMSLGDRIAVLNEGRVEQIGSGEELYSRPRTRFVADFFGESNFFPLTGTTQNGSVTIRGGTRVPRSAKAGTGDFLMVRPECLRVTAPGMSEWGVEGLIAKKSFLGSHVKLIVESAASDEPIHASLYRRDEAHRLTLEQGERVLMCWDPEDAIVVSDEPVGADV